MTAVFDTTEEAFERDVLERSKTTPVVVDFWAAWCGPCRTLSPVLERLADEANGAWVLAKVDVDSNQSLSAAFGVQGIPAVHAFKDGKEVARFVGALPEQQVRAWIQQLGPSEADLTVERARALEATDAEQALVLYRRALALEPGRTDAKSAVARLELAERVATADDSTPYARADHAFARGEVDEAARILIDLVRGGGDDKERARAHLVGLLDSLPADDARAMRARRELAAALY